MLNRTLAALLGGLLVAISWIITLNLTLPVTPDTRLLVGMIMSFIIWAGVMTWCYAACGWKCWQRWLLLFIPSAIVNASILLS